MDNANEAQLEKYKDLAKDNPTGFKVIINEFKKDKIAIASVVILAILWIGIFVGAALLDKEKVMTVDILNSYVKPGEAGHILGTDQGGRDLLGQLIIGARNSIVIGMAVTIFTSAIGIIIGLIIGYYGGWLDNVIMRIIDFIQILPTMMIIIVFVTVVPKYSMFTFVAIFTAFYWPGMARLVRSKALAESKKDYVNASKTMGTSDLKTMFTGILPNISSILIVDMTLSFAGNIGIETGLSFLGFGLPPTDPSLGTLIALARKPEVIQDKLYVWLPASLLILVMMLSINYIGQALRRASDAKQRKG